MKKKKIFIIVALISIAIIYAGYYALSTNGAETKKTNEEVLVKKNAPKIDGKKALIAYFSVPETTDINKQMTQEEENSTIVVNNEVKGNTQYVAEFLERETGGSIYRIEPKIPYTTNHSDLVAKATEEQNNNARPEILNTISNFDDYDTIFIGYPIWWGDVPQIMYNFLESYDFNGKTVIPFSTHGGSGLAGTVESINSSLSGATVINNALSISRNDMESVPRRVDSWLTELNLIK
ncbi:MAG: flavodoxin [Streptococcaceae bacterium]|jgi:flavodoxin|nr:flavodoxin [Streptococcaceae bacterium]MCH4176239.1 flavodoxin [Streptococcaceae bacterium]